MRKFLLMAAVAAAVVPAIPVAAVAAATQDSIAYKMARHDPLSPAALVGRKMFFDKSLSGSGRIACTSCHDPDHAYAPPNNKAVQPGGKTLSASGTRAVPSLRYKEYIPPYADLMDNPDGISTPGPGGGLTQDGRAPTLAEQAKIPLLSANEMANGSAAEVVAKIRKAEYAGLFKQAFGADVFANPQRAFQKAGEALQAFQMEDYSFHPFSSKYDLFAGNKLGGTFTPAEKRGFAVFMNPAKGNCFACHYNGPGINGSVGIFTDYTYAAIGVPRNPEIPANHKPGYYDLGICSRPDHLPAHDPKFCGMFKTPTLRNVATRTVFFHNGRFKTLREVIEFYNTRDTNPDRWYPVVSGKVRKYNDLPPRYRDNIDTQMPLDGRARGSAAPMSEQDMQDLEAFLGTLTDDYEPPLRNASTTAPASVGVTAAATQHRLQTALETYLESQGNLCLAKFDWPINVSERDVRAHTRDALQMPVLEKLGLVRSKHTTLRRVSDEGHETLPARRYELTKAGKSFYISKEAVTEGPGGGNVEHHKDFCAAKVTLDKVVGWAKPTDRASHDETTLTYTYHIAAASWMSDPDAQRVFPMVDRVIKGAGTMKLEQRMSRTQEGWVAVAPTT